MTQTSGLSHCLKQFKQFSDHEVSKAQFTSRISACESCQHRSKFDCRKHLKKCADFAKPKCNWCEYWGEPQNENIQKSRISTMSILTSYFNPTNQTILENNLNSFKEHLSHPVTVLELSYDGNFITDQGYHFKGDVQRHVLWQKERMLNIGIERLSADVDAVAWIDSDLIFENPNWLEETKQQLERYDLVQLYDRVNYIGQDGTVEKSIPSYGKSFADGSNEISSPGGAWAARRELLTGGLCDERITGGGDSEQIRRWVKQGLSIGYTRGTVNHLYHGDYSDRQYKSRYEILKRHQFNPAKDIRKDNQGLWEWASDKPDLHREVREYFESRNPKNHAPEVKKKVDVPPPKVKPLSSYDIDVFMPYYRNLHLVPETINSVLAQHDVKCFVHLVNDCSRENNTELKQRYGHLENIKWHKTKKNCGPYAISNSLVRHMVSGFIGIVDSDDIMLPAHFKTALNDLKQSGSDAWGSTMMQFLNPMENHNERNKRLIGRMPYIDSGQQPDCIPYPRLINGTMVIKKKTFEELNGFDGSMFCGADTEFSQRMQFPSDIRPKIYTSKEVTALRRVCSNSLSNSDDKFGLRSPERKAVTTESIRRYKLWKSQDKIEPTEYGNLDTQKDVLDADYKIETKRKDPVYICMATIPRRLYALKATIDSLIDQCDQFKIYLNNFNYVPEFLKNDKIELIFGDNSRRGSTKFFWADKVDGYILTVDDDLVYPTDYVKVMTSAIDKYKCIVGAHGNILPSDPPIESYYKQRTVLDARKEIKEDTFVDIVGTGTIGFHTDDIKLSMGDMIYPDREDFSIFKLAYDNSYTKVIVAHPEEWLKSSTHQNDLGLYGQAVLDDRLETEIINAHRNFR